MAILAVADEIGRAQRTGFAGIFHESTRALDTTRSHAHTAHEGTRRAGYLVDGEKQVDAYTFTSRGTRSDVRVINGSGVDCQHISSVFAWNGNGGFEFGYLIGFSNCPGHTGQYWPNPKKFYFAFTSQGSFVGCRVWENDPVPEETFQRFQVSDTNANGEWGSWYNGNELQPNGILMDFNSAQNGWGMERGDGTDNGYARFNNLYEYHDNSPVGWSTWDDQRLNADQDPKYRYDEINNYTGRTIE